jgi:hypothetical protein
MPPASGPSWPRRRPGASGSTASRATTPETRPGRGSSSGTRARTATSWSAHCERSSTPTPEASVILKFTQLNHRSTVVRGSPGSSNRMAGLPTFGSIPSPARAFAKISLRRLVTSTDLVPTSPRAAAPVDAELVAAPPADDRYERLVAGWRVDDRGAVPRLGARSAEGTAPTTRSTCGSSYLGVTR